MVVFSRNISEQIILDLRPLIEVARVAAGERGGEVEEAILDFLGNKLQIAVMLSDVRTHNSARIGIEAARGIAIDREEIFEKREAARLEGGK